MFTPKATTFNFDLTDRQSRMWNAIWRPDVTSVLAGGAKGGGKSYFLCGWAYTYANWIARELGIEPGEYPPHVGWLGRKQAIDFTGTTLETWKAIIPPDCYEIKGGSDKHPRHILINKRVAIDYGGLDRIEDVNKFNSAEYIFICIDQAEEVTRDDISVIRASLRKKIDGKELPFKELLTANPRQCWLKAEYIDAPAPGHVFVQSLPSDNEHLPAGYTDTLRDAFKHRPELLSAYLDGSWDAFEGEKQIITDRLLTAASKITLFTAPLKKYLVIDPARFGDDETVMYLFHNTNIVAQRIYGKLASDRLNNLAHVWALEQDVSAVVIDECGLGGPVVDWQHKLSGGQYDVIGINSAARSSMPDRYYNVRAEMWMRSAQMLSDGQIEFRCGEWMPEDDYRLLRSQLCVTEYDFRGSAALVEPKADIKERIGRSPDRSDTCVMGWYAYPRVSVRGSKPRLESVWDRETEYSDAMAC